MRLPVSGMTSTSLGQAFVTSQPSHSSVREIVKDPTGIFFPSPHHLCFPSSFSGLGFLFSVEGFWLFSLSFFGLCTRVAVSEASHSSPLHVGSHFASYLRRSGTSGLTRSFTFFSSELHVPLPAYIFSGHSKRSKRICFTDDERRRLAVKGKALGRKVLREVASIVTPDTIRLDREAADVTVRFYFGTGF